MRGIQTELGLVIPSHHKAPEPIGSDRHPQRLFRKAMHDTRQLAQTFGVRQATLLRFIRRHRKALERFGPLAPTGDNLILNDDQAGLLVALLPPRERIVSWKRAWVQILCRVTKELAKQRHVR